MKLKNFTKIVKWLAIYMIMLVVSVFVIELYRMRVAQKDIYNFMRIANNYALTATQDVSDLYDDASGHKVNIKSSIGLNVDGMYEKTEYDNYISALERAASQYEGEDSKGFLTMTSKILRADYVKALDKSEKDNGTVRGNSMLDEYLTYTPLSFNIPYVSYNVYKDCYEHSMAKMIEGYNIFGKPAIWIGEDGSPGLRNSGSNGSTWSYSPCRLDTPTDTEAHGYFTYENYNGNSVTFQITDMTSDNMWMIYGNEEYDRFVGSLMEIMTKSNSKYEDARFFTEGDNQNFYMPCYDIKVDTEWYYISFSSVLRIRGLDDMHFMSLNMEDAIFDNIPGVSVMGRGEAVNGGLIKSNYGTLDGSDTNTLYNRHQIMWNMRKRGASNERSGYTIFKRYIFVS